jgi:hypothetical protein
MYDETPHFKIKVEPAPLEAGDWETEINRLFEEQARDLARLEATGWHWVDPVSEEDYLEAMGEMEEYRKRG